MKQIKWIYILGMTLLLVACSSNTNNKAMQNEIIHTVSFTLKYEKGSAESKAFLDKAVEMLTDIPGVVDFTVLEQVSKKCNFQYHFSMRFADQAAYDTYNTHPSHVTFVSEYWMKEVADFMEQDYVKP